MAQEMIPEDFFSATDQNGQNREDFLWEVSGYSLNWKQTINVQIVTNLISFQDTGQDELIEYKRNNEESIKFMVGISLHSCSLGLLSFRWLKVNDALQTSLETGKSSQMTSLD